jgi:hypothetical protein
MRTIIFSCSDGRIADRLSQLARTVDDAVPDRVLLPGGPRTLARNGAARRTVKEALSILIEAHATEQVVLVAHQDCAAYSIECEGDLAAEWPLLLADLHSAAVLLKTQWPGLRVDCYVIPIVTRDPRRSFARAETVGRPSDAPCKGESRGVTT